MNFDQRRRIYTLSHCLHTLCTRKWFRLTSEQNGKLLNLLPFVAGFFIIDVNISCFAEFIFQDFYLLILMSLILINDEQNFNCVGVSQAKRHKKYVSIVHMYICTWMDSLLHSLNSSRIWCSIVFLSFRFISLSLYQWINIHI